MEMKSLIRVFPNHADIVTDAMVYKLFIKYTIMKDNNASVKIKIPKFGKGSLEHFLRFMIEFESGMNELGFSNNSTELCREFRAHASDRALSRFNIKYNQLTVNGMNEPIMDNYSNMIKYVITGFG